MEFVEICIFIIVISVYAVPMYVGYKVIAFFYGEDWPDKLASRLGLFPEEEEEEEVIYASPQLAPYWQAKKNKRDRDARFAAIKRQING
jgi:hypothetical protein